MQINFRVPEEDIDEDEVYPLNIKYNKNKVWKSNIYRFIFLFFIIIILIPSNFYTNNAGQTLSTRTGFYADQIHTKTISMSGINEYNLKIENWYTYILENIGSSSSIDVYVSASRSTSVSFSLSNSVQTISVQSDTGDVQWYVELYIPGGVTIPKLSITYNGDTNQNVLLYDYKSGTSWTTPMIISALTITISDSYPNIYFANAHTVTSLTVSGTYWICSFSTMKIASMVFTISVGSLNVNQNRVYTQNSIVLKTPHGTHCVAGATVNTVDSGWPSTSTRNSGYTGTYVDTSSYCTSTLYVWSNSASSCPTSGTAVSSGQGSFTITLDDGPVQFLIDGSTTTASLTYTPTYDQFAITSQILLSNAKIDFSSYTSDPRIYLYPTVSPGYSRMWVHSSLRQYIEARPWLLEILSLSVLSPTYYRNTLIHIPGNSCPYLSANNVKQNTYISLKLSSSVYTESSHVIAQAANSTYYGYIYTSKGDFIQSEIVFLTGNVFIFMSVIVSAIIAVFCVIVVFAFLIKFKTNLEAQYFKYLEENRNLSRSKKEIEGKINRSKKLLQVQNNIWKIKILELGLFTSKIVEKEVTFDDDEETVSKGLRKNKKSSISFFKIPELYIDKVRRSKANSFKMFFESIYESRTHFPEYKLHGDKYFTSVSTRLDLLKNKYLEFWTKEGVKPIEMDNESEILKEFNLIIEMRSDNSTDAYTNIRWKTTVEKQNDLDALKFEQKENQTEAPNSIVSFLKTEWVKSTFPNDFILVRDLKAKYNCYWIEQNIPDLLKINIVGSSEMSEFGSKFNQKFLVPYLKGIILIHLCGLSDTHFTPGVVRIPKDLNTKNQKVGVATKIKNRVFHILFSEEGVITNWLVVAIHILLILGIPYCLLLATLYGLLQIGKIDQDIYAVVFDINDVFYSSSYDFWLNSLHEKVVFYVIFGLCSWFFLCGFIEVICHYATGARDTGKYIVKRTWLRWMTTGIFYINILIFIMIYTAYISVILIWCILGAILNPQKFLPSAAGSGVFITFCILIFSRIKKIEKTLQEVVSKWVDSSIQNSLMSSFEKEREKLVNLLLRPVEAISQRLFNQSINSFMKLNGLSTVDKNVTDGILEGDAGSIAMLLHTSCGVEKNISLGLVGMLLQDKMIVMNSIYGLTEEHGLDGDFNVTIAEIAFNEYNPDTQGINQVHSTVILSIKKLIAKVFPQFPNDTIDGILQVVFEADPRPMEVMAEKLQIPPSLFKIIVGVATEEEKLVRDSIESLVKELLPEHYSHLFNAIYGILKGDSRGTLNSLANLLEIKEIFMLEMMVAVFKGDTDFVRYSINEFAPQLIELAKRKKIKLPIERSLDLKNFLLGVKLLMKGSELQIVKLLQNSLPNIDPNPSNVLYLASKGELKHMEIIIDNLGLLGHK